MNIIFWCGLLTRLRLTEDVGERLLAHSRLHPDGSPLSLALAQRVFVSVGNVVRACTCMLAVGRLHAALEHAARERATKSDYLRLVSEMPTMSMETLEALHRDQHASLTLADIVSAIQTRCNPGNTLLHYIQRLHKGTEYSVTCPTHSHGSHRYGDI